MAGCPRRWALKKWRQGRGMETQVKGCVGMELPRQMGLRPITHPIHQKKPAKQSTIPAQPTKVNFISFVCLFFHY